MAHPILHKMYLADILNRRREKFILWFPAKPADHPNPSILIGTYDTETDSADQNLRTIVSEPMTEHPDLKGLFEFDMNWAHPRLSDGVYHYYFEISDTSPNAAAKGDKKMRVTDPFAFTVDYHHIERPGENALPCSLIKYRDGQLWPCDEQGNEAPRPRLVHQLRQDVDEGCLASNNKMVIYELPASWVKRPKQDGQALEVDIGTFLDVCALFDKHSHGDNFQDMDAVANGQLLAKLGVNALELLPSADAKSKGSWGYATADYFAVDRDLGTATTLVHLVDTLHSKDIRFILDVVMGFGHDPYIHINYPAFHIRPSEELENPDSYQSGPGGVGKLREGYGGELWRYDNEVKDTYDPESGEVSTVQPAWSFHKLHLERWMRDFGIDGIRIDSVNNVGSWDFVREYRNKAWNLRKGHEEYSPGEFLVFGEELSMPHEMIKSGRLDCLWNRKFQSRIRAALLGEGEYGDNFEWTVRKAIDCKLDGFTDLSQAINYVTSHDLEGVRCERLYNFFDNVGIIEKEQRAKLAFACLMTAVGIPMIFAGEEFCDEHDLDIPESKQVDPVNYERVKDPWRKRLFDYVGVLVRLRKLCPSLQCNDLQFIHKDFKDGRRVMTWKRESPLVWRNPGLYWPIVVVANFSDEATPGDTYDAGDWEYRQRPRWREVTEHRWVPEGMPGREPLGPWDVKVYSWHVTNFSRGGPYVSYNDDLSWEYPPEE